MSDLISRQALLESLVHCKGLGRKSCELVMQEIKEQPMAYDVDKVRRRLNEAKDMDNQIDADHAIKIVREGGLNEQSITDII